MNETDIPHEFLCPITLDIMNEPVICNDGYTYEKNMIINLPNSISPITRKLIDKNNLIPNRNLKDAIERYKLSQSHSVLQNQKITNMNKLEKFEYEQKIKKQELQNKINNERLEKEKRDREEYIKKQKEEQYNIKLNRILEMFNSQNTALFNYGDFQSYNHGMNGMRNLSFTYNERGKHKYILTIEMLKSIKSQNKELISKKYDKMMNDYMWVQKYILDKETNGFVEFIFDEFIPDIDNLITKITQEIEVNEIIIKERSKYYSYDGCEVGRNQELITKLNLIKGIKNKEIKSKEYYIVNYEKFCDDFSIYTLRNDKLLNLNGKPWNILYYWVDTKRVMFNNLIINILDIYDDSTINNINFIKYTNYDYVAGGNCNPSITYSHILNMYTKVILSFTRINPITEQHHHESYIQSDYESKYFEPLIMLTKNILELIDFLQNDI